MITFKNIVLRRGVKILLDDASCTLNPGEKVALIGKNGAGKSSLFSLMRGDLHEDNGEFFIPRAWRIAEVAQEMPETDQSITDFVIQGDSQLAEAEAKVQAAQEQQDDDALSHALIELHDAGCFDAKARAEALILGLGFSVAQLTHPVNSFSGGWRMRLQLARALMCPSDLLLLDEPTNHLDLDALVWLEDWLKRYAGTMLVISHDREFLDATTNVTLHLDRAKLQRYGGNYKQFETLRAQQLALQQAAFSKQQEKIAHLQSFIDRFKAKASKAKQAQSRVKAMERMEKIAPCLQDAEFSFEFMPTKNLPNPMLVMTDISVGYSTTEEDKPTQTVIVKDINQSILAGHRIGVLGANGQGKSTLIKTIAKALMPLVGKITEGKGLSIGYFAQQELDVLRPDESPLEHMKRLAKECLEQGKTGLPGSREQELRNYLGDFNFNGDMVIQAVGSMSGGEKARLVLAMIVWQRPNLLLLDEPTNHLDLTTREALALALNEFDGAMLLVSHDRALLRSTCDEFWLVGRGGVTPFVGDMDDYQTYLLDEAKRQREINKQKEKEANALANANLATPSAAPKTVKASKPSQKLVREFDEVEKRLAPLQQEVKELQVSLAKPTTNTPIASIAQQLQEKEHELAALEEKWLTLSMLLGE